MRSKGTERTLSGHPRPSEAIQRPSEVVIGHQVAIRGVIRGHPRGHQGHSTACWPAAEHSPVIRGHQRSSEVIRATHLTQPVHELGLGEIIKLRTSLDLAMRDVVVHLHAMREAIRA